MSAPVERRTSTRSSSAAPTYTSPYEFTKTGVIGDQRESMLQSELQYLVGVYSMNLDIILLLSYSRN